VKRLRNELIRQHGLALSLDTIHRVLVRHGAQHLEQVRLRRIPAAWAALFNLFDGRKCVLKDVLKVG
jgi:hypothetical protein